MKIICYGDSNTYGYDPRSYLGGRYDADCRWVDILAMRTGWNVENWGINGREIPYQEKSLCGNFDLLVIMLGTNDLLQGLEPGMASNRMEAFLKTLSVNKDKLLLIAPPTMQLGEWVPTQTLVNASAQLSQHYQIVAQRLGIRFLDSGSWNIPITYDGVHFTEEGHKLFAQSLCHYLKIEKR